MAAAPCVAEGAVSFAEITETLSIFRLSATMKTRCLFVGTPTSVADNVASSTEHPACLRDGLKLPCQASIVSNRTGHSKSRSWAREARKVATMSVACWAAVSPTWSGSYLRHALPMRISGRAAAAAFHTPLVTNVTSHEEGVTEHMCTEKQHVNMRISTEGNKKESVLNLSEKSGWVAVCVTQQAT